MNYYNEFDPKAAAWLTELIKAKLIPDGKIDRRTIRDVQPADLDGFAQCHFFAGIGGWSLALRLAGWPEDRPAWTGSCPCQPLSTAGKQLCEKDERHLWPEFYRLISECRPPTIFGEQVASADGLEWLDGISLDLEELGYAVGSSDLPAAGVGAPHARQRLFFVANSAIKRFQTTRPLGKPLRSTPDAFREASEFVHAVSTRSGLPFLCERHHGVSDPVAAMFGLGNAIVPQIAAEFIKAVTDCI